MTKEELAEIIERTGQDWILSRDREQVLENVCARLNRVYAIYAEEGFESDGISLDDESIRHEPDASRLEALVQALPNRTPKFISAIWRIVHGDRITAIDMSYRERNSFEMKLSIVSKQGIRREVTSSDIEDAAFLRYLWIGRINEKPFFVGYFPPRFAGRTSAAIHDGT